MLKSDMSSGITTFYYLDDRCLPILQISLSPASSSNRAPSGETDCGHSSSSSAGLKKWSQEPRFSASIEHWRSRSRDRPGLAALRLNSVRPVARWRHWPIIATPFCLSPSARLPVDLYRCGFADNRGDTIRTCDLLLPKQALYQAKLRPVFRSKQYYGRVTRKYLMIFSP
jgi:hypothetical protein